MTDITSEKAARDALIESEKNLKQMNRQLLTEGRKRRYLSEKLIDLLERDRKQISMDLHDQVGQDLTTLKMDLDMLLRSFWIPRGALGQQNKCHTGQSLKDHQRCQGNLFRPQAQRT